MIKGLVKDQSTLNRSTTKSVETIYFEKVASDYKYKTPLMLFFLVLEMSQVMLSFIIKRRFSLDNCFL